MAQPGAQTGETVHCPVSGVAFEVQAQSHSVDVDGLPVYVCCSGCAQYMQANLDRVLELRGIDAAS